MDFEVELAPEKGKEKSGSVKLPTKDSEGRSEKAFDTRGDAHLAKVPDGAKQAQEAMSWLVAESDKLAKPMAERSYIDEKTRTIKTRKGRLFTDDEIMRELYTPLVRELVVPENFVPKKYSATQKMIDETNDPYIAECKAKGKDQDTGGVGLAKGIITVAASITTTALTALGPVKAGQDAIKGSGTLTDKDKLSEYSTIVGGVAALLTAGIDIVDQAVDYSRTGDFSVSGYQTVCNGLAMGIGKAVSGATANLELGMAVTGALQVGVAAVGVVPRVTKWAKEGGDFPLDELIGDIGGAVEKGLLASSASTKGDVSTWLSKAASLVSATYKSAASAQKKHLLDSIRGGDWKSVWAVLSDAGAQAAQATVGFVYTDQAAKASGFAATSTVYSNQQGKTDAIDKASPTVGKLPELVEGGRDGIGQLIGKDLRLLPDLPATELEKRKAAIEKAFKAKEKELAAQVSDDEMTAIAKKLDAEREEFQKSLDCLGSTKPDDAEFKSIAKLIAQIEKDRAIWAAVTTLGGAPFNVAAEFLAPLKAGGEIMKFIGNLKEAIDRGIALNRWMDARKDAKSAVSHYATSIENMIQNQREQISHYSIQAGLNLFKIALTIAQVSPAAPALKVATSALDMAASIEDMVFKFYKQQALRSAWEQTKKALADPENRKLNLIVREMNPTLAKYSLAYGALIERDTTAIGAMDRVGLDRETLARANAKVADVKNYLEKLYKDDNVVLGKLDADPSKPKLPRPALEVKPWALSHRMWTQDAKLATPNPPSIIAALTEVEKYAKVDRDTISIEDLEAYVDALDDLATGFTAFIAVGEFNQKLPDVQKVVQEYRERAEARRTTTKLDLQTKRDALLNPKQATQ